jgi:hypothetical protein
MNGHADLKTERKQARYCPSSPEKHGAKFSTKTHDSTTRRKKNK